MLTRTLIDHVWDVASLTLGGTRNAVWPELERLRRRRKMRRGSRRRRRRRQERASSENIYAQGQRKLGTLFSPWTVAQAALH